jgi:hypothetical protein
MVLNIHGEFNVLDSNDDGRYWREFHLNAASVSPGASGATLSVGGPGSASLYYLLNATNEYLYFSSDIHSDWDGASDIIVIINVALDGNEDQDDTIDAELIAEYFADHDDMDVAKTQTRTIGHSIGGNKFAGTVHELIFALNWDETDNVIEVDDILKLRFRLDSVASIGAVRFLDGNVLYRTSKPAEEIGTFPSEG